MTEMEEIKTMLADMNKKLDKVVFQNKIALNTKYGSPIKEMEELRCKKFREVKHEAVKEFAEKLKSRKFDKDMFNDWAGATYVVLVRDIDELLKEYEE